MNEHQKVEDRLRKKEREIIGLEEKIKAAHVYVQALRDVLKMMSTDDAAAPAILRSGSAVAKAREEIMRQGIPVHISDLLKALGKDQTRVNRASLTSSLSAYVRSGEIFTRPEPNTFGLIELGQTESAEETLAPPTGFGKDTVPPAEPVDIDQLLMEKEDDMPF